MTKISNFLGNEWLENNVSKSHLRDQEAIDPAIFLWSAFNDMKQSERGQWIVDQIDRYRAGEKINPHTMASEIFAWKFRDKDCFIHDIFAPERQVVISLDDFRKVLTSIEEDYSFPEEGVDINASFCR